MISFDSFTKYGRDGAEATMKSFQAMSSGLQTVASENVDYAKRSLEEGQKAAEQLFGAKTFESALQIQGDYVRSSYESLVAQTSKIGQLTVDTAKQAAAPFEGFVKAA